MDIMKKEEMTEKSQSDQSTKRVKKIDFDTKGTNFKILKNREQ